MSNRPSRNIRKKSEEEWGKPDDQPVLIKTRLPAKKSSHVSEKPLMNLSEIQDRVLSQAMEIEPIVQLPDEETINDEDYLLQKRAEQARLQREAARTKETADYISLEDQETNQDYNPLSLITETGVNEEVFEDLRGSRIDFGMVKADIAPAEDDLIIDGEEAQEWEMKQIQKGMASAGIKSDRASRKASEKIFKETVFQEKMHLIQPVPLHAIQEELQEKMRTAETKILECHQKLEQLQLDKATIEKKSNDLMLLEDSQKSDFLEEFSSYISSFSQFADEATRLLDDPLADSKTLDTFFDDTLAEFSDAQAVLAKFKEFEETYPDEYADAFIDHHLPFILEPFIQRQFRLHSKPLTEGYRNISTLLEELGFDSIRDSVKQRITEQIYIPRLFTLLVAEYDPSDNEQTTKLIQALADIESYLSKDDRNVAMFRMILVDSIEEAKASAEPGSDRLQRILLSQSMLNL